MGCTVEARGISEDNNLALEGKGCAKQAPLIAALLIAAPLIAALLICISQQCGVVWCHLIINVSIFNITTIIHQTAGVHLVSESGIPPSNQHLPHHTRPPTLAATRGAILTDSSTQKYLWWSYTLWPHSHGVQISLRYIRAMYSESRDIAPTRYTSKRPEQGKSATARTNHLAREQLRSHDSPR